MNLPGRKSVCPYRDRLEAFWDAQVSPEERQRVEAHLSVCATCRRYLQELQSLTAALKTYGTPAALTLPILPRTQDGVPRTQGGVPASAWTSDAEFWRELAPRLPPRVLPAAKSQDRQPSPFLAPVSLVVSSLALRGVAALALIAYALDQWRLLPAGVSAAFSSAAQLVLGPWVWQRGQVVYSDLVTALAPFLVAPGQVWLLTFEASASALLLLLAGLHTGWLLRWLRNQSSPAQNAGWNTELQSMAATE